MMVSSTSALVLLPALVDVLRPRFLGIKDEPVPALALRPVPQAAASGGDASHPQPPHLFE
jgi:hypothetical protein